MLRDVFAVVLEGRQQQRQAVIREMPKINNVIHTGIPDFQHSTLHPERWKWLLKHP